MPVELSVSDTASTVSVHEVIATISGSYKMEYRGRFLPDGQKTVVNSPGDTPPERRQPLYGILSLVAFISAFPVLNFLYFAELILPVMFIFMAAGLVLGIAGLNEKPRFPAVLGLILSAIGLILVMIALVSVFGGIFL